MTTNLRDKPTKIDFMVLVAFGFCGFSLLLYKWGTPVMAFDAISTFLLTATLISLLFLCWKSLSNCPIDLSESNKGQVEFEKLLLDINQVDNVHLVEAINGNIYLEVYVKGNAIRLLSGIDAVKGWINIKSKFLKQEVPKFLFQPSKE